jgi:hypothetical protein
MQPAVNSLTGTLLPDGSLRLDRIPELPPGPYEIQLHPIAPAPTKVGDTWWDYLRDARRELEAADCAMRTREQIDADLQAQRDEWKADSEPR